MNNKTYSYFGISSDDEFAPNEISALLHIQPQRAWRKGEKWRTLPHTGETIYRTFSSWTGCEQHQPINNAHEQCLNIVRQLRPKTAELLLLKQKYHLNFRLQVVPKIHDTTPAVFFDREIIAFCHEIGAEIDVDIYVYHNEE